MVSTPELFARRKIFAFSRNTFEVIRIVLEAVPCLIGVREAGIKPSGLKNEFALSGVCVGHCDGVEGRFRNKTVQTNLGNGSA